MMAALDTGAATGGGYHVTTKPRARGDAIFGLVFLLIMFGVPIIFMIVDHPAHSRARSRATAQRQSRLVVGKLWSNDSSGLGGGGGGGSDWGGGGGGGGDSGFSGGGGDFGGGGSSDSF